MKIWDRESGKPFTSIEATADFNDLCLYKNSGLMFLANEQPKMQVSPLTLVLSLSLSLCDLDFNDLCLYKNSGLMFLPNEQPKMQVSSLTLVLSLSLCDLDFNDLCLYKNSGIMFLANEPGMWIRF